MRDFKPRAGEEYPVGPLVFEPGEQWLYSTSTEWLGRLVEKISGAQLEDYFRKHILDPLGMSDTLLLRAARQAGPGRHGQSPPTRRLIGEGARAGAHDGLRAHRRRRHDVDRKRLHPLHADAAQRRRARRRPHAVGQLGGHDGAKITSAPIGVPALEDRLPERSEDFSFIADGRDKWGLGFLISADAIPGKRSAGSLSWGGINNTYFWIDRTRGITGVILMQFLPFADRKALALYDAFERGVYQLAL